MVNADAFKASKPSQVFIDLGRGPVVDEDALLESLKNGTLRAAALDVFAKWSPCQKIMSFGIPKTY